MDKYITIKDAKVHNLKGITLKIPREKLVVLTGISGSGKSSLAFDTIYAEGQRRYVESLSSYARQFLGQMDKPDVESITGLSPAISIDQKTTSKNPRSTVGTVTEIYDYLRLLYARIGIPHCPVCGKVVSRQTVDQITDKILSLPEGAKIHILAPVIKGKKGEHKKIFEDAKRSGYVRVKADGIQYDLSEPIILEKNIKHDIEIIVDRLIIRDGIESRLTDSVETALNLSGDVVMVEILDGEILKFNQNLACDDCGISLTELAPRSFSFNNPIGACTTCKGLGFLTKIDPELLIVDENRTLLEGAINCMGWAAPGIADTMAHMYFKGILEHFGVPIDTKWKDLPEEVKNTVLYGTNGEKFEFRYNRSYGSGTYYAVYEGIVNNLERRYNETTSEYSKTEIEKFINETECPDCHGKRLNDEILAVTVGGKNIYDFTCMSIKNELDFINNLKLTDREQMIANQIIKEITARLQFLIDVGLDYLTLSRASSTLSGGEAQRIRLATQIGSGLMGVLYILDEPSIGLHQRDNNKLIGTLKHLRDIGNTVIVVEHDEDTMYAADYIVDIGPGAGVNGGNVVAMGTAEQIKKSKKSVTGQYLSGSKFIPIPENRRKPTGFIKICGASENNLKNIDVEIPLGVFTCITGVSGSGKSSLINEILYKELAKDLTAPQRIQASIQELRV